MLHIETRQEVAPMLVAWFKQHHGMDFTHNLQRNDVRAFALTDYVPGEEKKDDKVSILSVVIFHNWTASAVEISIGSNGERRQKNSHDFMFTIYNYVFNVAKRTCVFGHIAVDNEKSLAFVETVGKQLGFKKVGLVPDYYGQHKDAWLYALTKRDWIKAINKGQTEETVH